MKEKQQSSETSQPEAKQLIEKKKNIFFALMEQVGTSGPYQNIVFLFWIILSYQAGGITLMPSFLFFQDAYICNDQSSEKSCLDFVCSLPKQQRQAYIPLYPSIYSIANKFQDYHCDPQAGQLTLMITLAYSGVVLCVLFISILGDIVGRKNLIFINLLIMLLGFLLIIFCQNIWMAGAGLFCCVFGAKNNSNLTLMFVSEIFNDKLRQISMMVLQTMYCVGGLGNVLLYYLLQSFELVLVFGYVIPSLIVGVAIVFFIKDTPIGLVTKCSAKDAYNSLCFIAKINKKHDFNMKEKEIENLQQTYKSSMKQSKSKNFSIVDLFQYKSLRYMTIIFIILDFSIDLEFFSPTFMLDQFKFSIYINGIVVQSSQIIASIVVCFLVNRVKRKIYAYVSFAVIMICSIVLIFIWDQNNEEEVTDIGANSAVLALIFVIQFTITAEFNLFITNMNELFPVQVRVIGIGFVKTWGGAGLMLSPLIIDACLDSGFRIMILFASLAALCALCYSRLAQSFGKRPPEVIEELKGSLSGQEGGDKQ